MPLYDGALVAHRGVEGGWLEGGRLHSAQRQALARRAGQLQGNRRLQRLVTSRQPAEALAIQRQAAAPTYAKGVAQPPVRTVYQQYVAEHGEPLQWGFSSEEGGIPEPEWIAQNLPAWADEAMVYIWQRIGAGASSFPAGTMAQPGDEAWLDEVINSLTGLAYERAHRLYGGPSKWRQEYQGTGQYPIVSVCDQLGELVQWIRGLSGYGSGLTAHFEFYLGKGALSSPPVDAQPGVTLFHTASSGAGHALDIEPWSRVPRVGAWTKELAQAARQQQNQVLGGSWSADAVRSVRQQAAQPEAPEGETGVPPAAGPASTLSQLDSALDAIYLPDRYIKHETTIIRTLTEGNVTRVQLFDFLAGVAQEGTTWHSVTRYDKPDEYYWGYQPAGATRYLTAPRGKGSARVEYVGQVLREFDLSEPLKAGASDNPTLLPTSHYLWALSGVPYTDLLDVKLTLSVEDLPVLRITIANGGNLQMEDLTPPGG